MIVYILHNNNNTIQCNTDSNGFDDSSIGPHTSVGGSFISASLGVTSAWKDNVGSAIGTHVIEQASTSYVRNDNGIETNNNGNNSNNNN